MKRNYSVLAAFIAVFFWASAFPGVKYCLHYYSPEALMLFRFLVASVVLMIYCIIKKVPPPRKKDIPMFALSGFIGIFCYMWAFNFGTSLVASGVSSFIIASGPVFTLILAAVFLKEKTPFYGWMGVLVSLFGLIMVACSQVREMTLNFGVMILIMAAVFSAVFNVTQRKLLTGYTPMQVTAYSILFATFFMLLFAPKLIKELPEAPVVADLLVIYLGVFPAAVSYFLWGYALGKAKNTSDVVGFLYLSPFIATLLAYLWLNEQIPAMSFVGGFVIIAGMLICNKATNRKKKPEVA
jgi:drug/metabolite transporter (DMT)-like permease